jgi:hypothetical protein
LGDAEWPNRAGTQLLVHPEAVVSGTLQLPYSEERGNGATSRIGGGQDDQRDVDRKVPLRVGARLPPRLVIRP